MLFRKKTSPVADELIAILTKIDKDPYNTTTEEDINTFLEKTYRFMATLPQSGSALSTFEDGSRRIDFYPRKS